MDKQKTETHKKQLPVWVRAAGGAALGLIGGIVYQQLVGCRGGCPITSSPVYSGLYGMVIGLVAFLPFTKKNRSGA